MGERTEFLNIDIFPLNRHNRRIKRITWSLLANTDLRKSLTINRLTSFSIIAYMQCHCSFDVKNNEVHFHWKVHLVNNLTGLLSVHCVARIKCISTLCGQSETEFSIIKSKWYL